MTKGRLVFLLVSALFVAPLVSGAYTGAWARTDDGEDSLYKYLSVFTEVLRLVRTAYVEDADLPALMSGALDGATDALDPFSVYVPSRAVKDYERSVLEGQRLSGLLILKDRGVAYVAGVDEGSPADQAGIEHGDILSKVEGFSTRDLPMWRIRRAFAQEPGTAVSVEVVRRGEAQDLSVVLGGYEPAPARLRREAGWTILQLGTLGPETPEQVQQLLAEVEGPLLVDLRGVSSTSAPVAYQIGRLFAAGRLGELRGRSGTVETFEGAETGPVRGAGAGPLAVLVDRRTLAAGEIMAAILVQQADAVAVGERTFGHAGHTSRVTLSNGSMLEITDAFYTGPDGEPLNEPLIPELEVRIRRFGDAALDYDQKFLDRSLELLAERSSTERQAA